jgi:hypothetical protein
MRKFLSKGNVWVAGPPDIYGQPTFTGPIVVRHRWEERSGMFINAQGRQEAFKSRVYMDYMPKPGDRLSKRLSDALESSFEIKDVRQVLNVSGKSNEIRVLL